MQSHKILRNILSDKYIWLTIAWSVGLSFGILAGVSFSGQLSSFILYSCFYEYAFAVPSAILPITLVWIVYRCATPGLIYIILSFKAFLDGCILLAIAQAFGSASWLMGILVFFTDRIATSFLIYFSAQCLQRDRRYIDRCYITFMLLIAAVIAIDYFYISDHLIYFML